MSTDDKEKPIHHFYSRAGKGHQMNFPIKLKLPKDTKEKRERLRKKYEEMKSKHALLKQEFDFDKIDKDFDAITHSQLVMEEKIKKIKAKEQKELTLSIQEANERYLREMI